MPPKEWPASTKGRGAPAARSRAFRSRTMSRVVRGIATGSLRLKVSGYV